MPRDQILQKWYKPMLTNSSQEAGLKYEKKYFLEICNSSASIFFLSSQLKRACDTNVSKRDQLLCDKRKLWCIESSFVRHIVVIFVYKQINQSKVMFGSSQDSKHKIFVWLQTSWSRLLESSNHKCALGPWNRFEGAWHFHLGCNLFENIFFS